MRHFISFAISCALIPSGAISATNVNLAYDQADAQTLPSVVVEAEAESDHVVQGPFLPDVQGTKINVGKKTTMIDLDALPSINASNYRQALLQTPGLILSEESSPLLSIGYRGLEPHRTQYTQVLKDGIPIHADQFGYPEAYYVPPLDTVDRIEFIRGGGSLMYGPQPGGALNYVTHRPRLDREFSGATSNTFGSDSAWNSFSYLDGTSGRLGYYGYYNHREGDGFRAENSDILLNAGLIKLALDADGPRRWFLTLESYRERHGEPGGLTLTRGAQDLNYDADRTASSRRFDRFELERDAATLSVEQDLDAGQFIARAWISDYTRYSRRQRGGGFGALATGANAASNDIENQNFKTFGLEGRFRRDWGGDSQHVFTVGAQIFRSDSPRTDTRGASANATSGVLRIASERDMDYTPVFAENLFRFGNFSITPGVRIEHYRQSVNTRFVEPAATARARVDRNTVPLFGLGTAFNFSMDSMVYFNATESYRPPVFTEAVPNSTTTVVSGDLAEGSSWQSDLGFRSTVIPNLVVDASVFYMNFKDKIGGAGTFADPLRNIGEIKYRGIEAALNYDFLGAATPNEPKLNGLLNVTVLNAEISRDSVATRVGKTPQYAPDYVVRAGLIYAPSAERKIALLATFVDDSFADDSNSANRFMPGYKVWDLTGEWQISDGPLTALAGITNLLDEKYYSRIRNDGIDPAPGRNFYLGLRAAF